MRNEFSCELIFEEITENVKSVEKMFVRCHDDSNEVS